MSFLTSGPDEFKITVEVVPPPDHDARPLMEKILSVSSLGFDGFSVASNPVANPRMSAMVFTHLLQEQTGKPAILHMTVRDHNRLGLQAELLGARALGIDTMIAVTGDPSARHKENPAKAVNDLNVFDLISVADDAGLHPGAVLDFRPEVNGLDHEIGRVERKVRAGARFIVTQPIYDSDTAIRIKDALSHITVPVIMGILPLLSARHGEFLHTRVDGIAVPEALRSAMAASNQPLGTGVRNSCEMLELARDLFYGACVMPPFERFDILDQIL